MNQRLAIWSIASLGWMVVWMVTPGARGAKKANWLTDGGDQFRNAWQRDESIISKDSVKQMKLAWTIKLDNEPRQMHNLFPPLIVSDVATADGTREIAVVGGISDNLYGIDVAKGALLWKRKFDSTFVETPGGRGSVLCPGGLTATPVIGATGTPGKYIAYAISWDGRLRKVDVATGADVEPAEPFLPPNGKPYGLNLVKNVLYTTTAQGCGGNPNAVYAYDLATKKVGQYLPGSGGMWPRSGPTIGKDGTLYVGTGDGDYYPERQIYGQTIIGVKQDADTKALVLKDWYTPSNAFWLRKRDLDMNVSGPIFDWKGKEYLVQSSKECRMWLLDTAALGGEDHRTPVYRTPLVCNEDVNFAAAGTWGALASWEDKDGTRYVLIPFWGPLDGSSLGGADHKVPLHVTDKYTAPGATAGPATWEDQGTRWILAPAVGSAGRREVRGQWFETERRDRRVQARRAGGKITLEPAWASPDMTSPLTPVIFNGVVFASSSGEYRGAADSKLTAAQRAQRSIPAVLYALDPLSGKPLWNSGKTITSFARGGLSAAAGQVYLVTFDNTLYVFGIPMEH